MALKIFKFGGASVKDADSVRNVASVLNKFSGQQIITVVSAMGKITNLLEMLVDAYFYQKGDTQMVLEQIKKYHFDILKNLFPIASHPVYNDVNTVFLALENYVKGSPSHSYNKDYDQIVSQGEIISSKIVSAYLMEAGIKNSWLDIRSIIKTDDTYREGKVNWDLTQKLVTERVPLSEGVGGGITLTQGFLGQTPDGFTTTLGREGSDYTAAILAHCTNAESVTIWKDVHGVMNADPKWFDETKLIDQMSYQDAIELSYYGATVIHPKTIKPLQNKKIPLYVRSFVQPDEKGTLINDQQSQLPIPCFIFKVNQILLSISPKDFSFIVEENFSDIFKIFSEHHVKINVMQNSAISFSVCTDNDERKIPELIKTLQKKFRVLYNDNMELITIRYYNQTTIERVCIGKKVFLEHKSRYTVQLVVKNR
ncbi:MAG: aspartate kinase [Bacteroidetes bacterium]|nr:MAG: aspartate kinase [Bacteroidota bacterium]